MTDRVEVPNDVAGLAHDALREDAVAPALRDRIIAQLAIAAVSDPEAEPSLRKRLGGYVDEISPMTVLSINEHLAAVEATKIVDTMIRGFGGQV